jgi:hypothetical protein
MHHLRETTIDGMKFVLIPEELHDKLALYVKEASYEYCDEEAANLMLEWKTYDPEIFDGL